VSRLDQIIAERDTGHWNLRRFRSKVYDDFMALEEATFADGELPTKTKELIAVGIAIQAHSEPAIQSHIERAAGCGASLNEIVEAIEVGIEMGGATALESARFSFFVLDRLYSREILKR
jgi:AhpD family alkylhydroperoxidase